MAGLKTRIKFCGLVRAQDVDTAVALGVDAVGFVFYPKSPRLLAFDEAAALRRRLPSWVSAVGLFVNATEHAVRAARAEVGLDVIQFHGDESPEHCQIAAGSAAWWRGIRMRSPADLLNSFEVFSGAEALLVDSFHPGYGGSGQAFDWSWVPQDRPVPLVLSGGLDAGCVGSAMAQVRPQAVDVSSGIQGNDPRTKDSDRMAAFVQAVIETDARFVSTSQSGQTVS